jgi:hypothetical protein
MLEALLLWIIWLMRQALPWLPFLLWCAWWLWCVNWKQAWGVLARGGWVGVVLLTFLSAVAWSRISPHSPIVGGVTIPNFWWRLGESSALVLVALFCGWLQGWLGWTPEEVSFDPPEHHHGHGHHAHHGHSAH